MDNIPKIAQGSNVDPEELFRYAKEIICGPAKYLPNVMVVGGHAMNGLLNTNEYEPGKCYYVTKDGIYEVLPPEYESTGA